MRIHKNNSTCTNPRVDMCMIDMGTDRGKDMCIDMGIEMCVRHAYRRVYRNVYAARKRLYVSAIWSILVANTATYKGHNYILVDARSKHGNLQGP